MSHTITIGEFSNIWYSLTRAKVCPGVNFPTDGAYDRMSQVLRAASAYRESVSFYQTIDIIGEGEIDGLCDQNGNTILLSNDKNKNSDYFKGVYYNETPVKNTNSNTFNYRSALSEIRLGTEGQLPLQHLNSGLSFAQANQTFNYGVALYAEAYKSGGMPTVKLNNVDIVPENRVNHMFGYPYDTVITTKSKPAFAYSEFPMVHTITNHNVDSVVINMSYTGTYQHDGKYYTNNVSFVVQIGYEGDSLDLNQGGSNGYAFCSIRGFASSEYVRSYHFPLPPSDGEKFRFIKIIRVDMEYSPDFIYGSKSLSVSSIVENINAELRYPNSVILANIFDASAFAQIPKRTYDVKLLKINVPSNYDPEAKIYSGSWNGTFAVNKQWTDNPAWILYDIITNNRYGLGKYAFQTALMDKWNLYSIAKYCDEFVPTGNSGRHEKISFFVDSGNTIFEVATSASITSSYLGSILELGSTICFVDLKDSNSADVNLNYKGIIKSVKTVAGAYQFEILQDFGVDNVFFKYPNLKKNYLFNRETFTGSAKEWLIDALINKNAELEIDEANAFYAEFNKSISLNSTVVSGSILRQYEEDLDILESRFTCNLVFTGRDEALNTINNIAAVFRGITYWNEGLIFPSIDKKKDPVLMFNNSNVSGGSFSYAGSAKTSRTSSIVVRYNDASDNFKTKIQYAEDLPALREFGYNEQEVVALGTTSRSQAKRIAQWMLLTNQTETDVVQFSTGQEGSFLMPGDVISVQDNFKTTKRYGGRLTDISYRDRTVTLDKGVAENVVNQKIFFMVPKSVTTSKDLSSLARQRQNSNSGSGVTDSEIENQRTPQIKSFTISSVTSNNQITISETTDEDFNLITRGTIWSIENESSDYDIKNINYRVLTIEEKALNEFMITALLYNRSKFDAFERGLNLQKTQESKELKFEITGYPAALTGAVASSSLQKANLTSEIYDAYLVSEKSENDIMAVVDFSSLVQPANTGGYVVDFSVWGRNLRFCLDGADNKSFKVFLGDKNKLPSSNTIKYKIYVYDKDFKLEQLNQK